MQSGESDLSSNYERKRIKHAGAIVKILSASSLQELNSKAESQSFQTPAELCAYAQYFPKCPPLEGVAFCAQFVQGPHRSCRIFLHESWIGAETPEPAALDAFLDKTGCARIKPGERYRVAKKGIIRGEFLKDGGFPLPKNRKTPFAGQIIVIQDTFANAFNAPGGFWGLHNVRLFRFPLVTNYFFSPAFYDDKPVWLAKFEEGGLDILLHESWIGKEVTEDEAASKR